MARRKLVLRRRNRDQMHVIGHQAVAPNLDPLLAHQTDINSR